MDRCLGGTGQFPSYLFLPLFFFFLSPIARIQARSAIKHGGKAPPEARLYMAQLGGILVPIGNISLKTPNPHSSLPSISVANHRSILARIHHLSTRPLDSPHHRLNPAGRRNLPRLQLRLHLPSRRIPSHSSISNDGE